ncbi:hypothetical protein L3Y34_000510 [Caenorhabditis briggsae]|uniref:Uncharacterized protein n=1 Tax=Caenorhabditis briggsae TaxID=6238 RepID=A0AAE9D9L0_CAEBR|nr:hypothetical protein L3Y34_000510 [Caenorhabditis briggsae]
MPKDWISWNSRTIIIICAELKQVTPLQRHRPPRTQTPSNVSSSENRASSPPRKPSTTCCTTDSQTDSITTTNQHAATQTITTPTRAMADASTMTTGIEGQTRKSLLLQRRFERP